MIYMVPESANESGCITALELVQGLFILISVLLSHVLILTCVTLLGMLLQNLDITKTASLESVLKIWFWSLKQTHRYVSCHFALLPTPAVWPPTWVGRSVASVCLCFSTLQKGNDLSYQHQIR